MVFVLVVFSGVFIVFLGLRQRSQQLELVHKERMAMIERGLTPTVDPILGHAVRTVRTGPSSRSMSLGIIVIALGLGLMLMIAFAADAPETAVGVGGAITIVGIAFVVNSLVNRSTAQMSEAPGHDERS
jgi:uncharacterized membrane protein HdeD (DUF308 family)